MKRPLCVFAAAALLLLTGCMPERREPPIGGRSVQQQPPLIGERNVVTPKGVIPPMTPAIKVALLLPLSGESVSVGNAMLDAATMALYDNYISTPSNQIHSQIILLPKDTGNTPAEAARAAKMALDQGASFIVGPLFSQSVNAVTPLTREKGITMLTFSNNKAVAAPDTFVFGFLPEQQINHVAEYAFLHNYQRVALLAPNDAYGQKVQETLIDAYNKKGGVVAPTELYAPSPTNIDAAVGRLAAFNNANQDRRFEAIFIADGGYQLKNIIASLKKTNIDLTKVKLLGTGLWDDPEIAKIPEMSGAWFSSSPPESFRNFERRFMATYNYKPVRLASLAYDAVTLLVSTVMPTSNATISRAALTNPAGFHNLTNGLVRLNEDGTSERKLTIVEITPSGFKVIDPASKSFIDPRL